MNEVEAIEIGREAIWVMLKISMPVLMISLIVGLVISLFQTMTQLQEMTLTFVPKLIVISVALIALSPFMLHSLAEFWNVLMDRMISLQ
ncbi:flagellar biosynthesis protein FliQ [Kiloniella sp. b19]|uniref:flagellar biosynthesis protein FliQ n=1 Tax=Kiloniella sp. GXU_MW_B19 TaxID=3141326 RepID=UPI0031D51E79